MQDKNTDKNTPALTRLHYLTRDTMTRDCVTRGAPRAHRRWAALGIALLTGMGMVAVSAPASAQRPQAPGGDGQIVVRSSPEGLSLSRNVIPAGEVTITVKASKANLASAFMFKLVPPATLATLSADLADTFSGIPPTAARGARNLTRHARFYGLVEASAGRKASLRQTLSAGTYYLTDNFDLAKGSPHLVPLTVHGSSRGHTGHEPGHNPRVTMTKDNRFDVPRSLPAKATISVRNASDSLHEMKMWRVRPGTTDKKVQTWIGAGGPELGSPFVDNEPSSDLNWLSPGRKADMTYDLPTGTYLFHCAIPDAKTGIRHVTTGMYKVVTLR